MHERYENTNKFLNYSMCMILKAGLKATSGGLTSLPHYNEHFEHSHGDQG